MRGGNGFPNKNRNDLASDGADDSKGEEEEKFCVEKVINMCLNKKGKEEFLVKWAGYPLSQAKWEPADHLSGEEACKCLFLLIHPIA